MDNEKILIWVVIAIIVILIIFFIIFGSINSGNGHSGSGDSGHSNKDCNHSKCASRSCECPGPHQHHALVSLQGDPIELQISVGLEISWNSEISNPVGMFNGLTPTDIVIKSPGLYSMGLNVHFDNLVPTENLTYLESIIIVNGGIVSRGTIDKDISVGDNRHIYIERKLILAEGDVVKSGVLVEGATAAFLGHLSYFDVVMLSPLKN